MYKQYVLCHKILEKKRRICLCSLTINTIKISFFISSDELMHSLRETLKIVKDIPHILKVEGFLLFFMISVISARQRRYPQTWTVIFHL